MKNFLNLGLFLFFFNCFSQSTTTIGIKDFTRNADIFSPNGALLFRNKYYKSKDIGGSIHLLKNGMVIT